MDELRSHPNNKLFYTFNKNIRSEGDFSDVLKLISKYKVISQCYKKADHFINLASNSLSIFKNTEEKKILENLTLSINRSSPIKTT